jgi:thiosulfate dehydrogenase (quinone) large subunit
MNHQVLTNFIFSNERLSPVWFLVRVYVGWLWFSAGLEKITNPAWVGGGAGGAIKGFVGGALKKTGGEHPDVSSWYAWFLENVVLPNANVWSHAIAYGEVLVGLALILGIFTLLGAFFGSFMNLNFLFAGTVSVNPLMLILSIGIMLAWRVSGKIGLNYVLVKLFPKWRY